MKILAYTQLHTLPTLVLTAIGGSTVLIQVLRYRAIRVKLAQQVLRVLRVIRVKPVQQVLRVLRVNRVLQVQTVQTVLHLISVQTVTGG